MTETISAKTLQMNNPGLKPDARPKEQPQDAGPDFYLVTVHALAPGLSDPSRPGRAVHSTLAEGAVTIASALFKAGVAAPDLDPFAALFAQDVSSLDLVSGSEALFGAHGERIPYTQGSPLGSFVSALCSQFRDTPDLKAAAEVVKSVQAKLALYELSMSAKTATEPS